MSDKPCPFCASRNIEVADLGTEERAFFTVICRQCEAEGPMSGSQSEALSAWNTRRRARHDGDGAV